jgi:hypothetical protein
MTRSVVAQFDAVSEQLAYARGSEPSRDREGAVPPSANWTLAEQARRAKESSPRREPWVWQDRLESPGTGRKAFLPTTFFRPVPGLYSEGPAPTANAVGYSLSPSGLRGRNICEIVSDPGTSAPAAVDSAASRAGSQ